MSPRIALSALQQRNYLTGTGRHISDLFAALARADPANEYLLYLKPDQVKAFLKEGNPGIARVLEGCPSSPIKRVAWEWLNFTKTIVADGVDLYHGPANFLPLKKVCPYVLTLHDMVYFHNPERTTLLRAKYWQWTLRRIWPLADRIITVSEFSRTQIQKYLPVPDDRIHVIPNGVDNRYIERASDELRHQMRRELKLDDPYVLYVGRLDPDKNVSRIVEAFALLCEQGLKGHRLVIAGAKDHRGSDAAERARSLGIEERVLFTGYIKEEHLPAIYQECAAFCFPSLNEGFGLPVLEAMASGVPVVTSNISSLPEVAGDTGILVDPFSSRAIADGLRQVLGTTRGAELAQAGRQRARTFTWQSAALQHLEVYREVLSSKG